MVLMTAQLVALLWKEMDLRLERNALMTVLGKDSPLLH